MSETCTVLVATHKSAPMPEDPMYLPVHVGHALATTGLGYQADDAGENISALNRSYCELTGLYWAWKNLDADAVGLSHYRRYFVGTGTGPRGSRILSSRDARDLLARYDVVIAKPRNYVVETIETHFRNAHHGEDLDVLRAVLAERHPEYLPSLERVLGGRTLSLYNMMLMRRDAFEQYAGWLFDVLDAAAQRIDDTARTAYQQRTMGYLGERLLNVWVDAHRGDLAIGTRRVVNTEGEPKVKKAVELLRRKLTGTRSA